MAKRIIPEDVKKEVKEIVAHFNSTEPSARNRLYVPRFKGKYLYLDRNDVGDIGPICRLEYTGKMDSWEFAIYKYSSEVYSTDEFFFPGEEHVDGTVQGAMMCGLEAYE